MLIGVGTDSLTCWSDMLTKITGSVKANLCKGKGRKRYGLISIQGGGGGGGGGGREGSILLEKLALIEGGVPTFDSAGPCEIRKGVRDIPALREEGRGECLTTTWPHP